MNDPIILDPKHISWAGKTWTMGDHANSGPWNWLKTNRKAVLAYIGGAFSSGGIIAVLIEAVKAAGGDWTSPIVLTALSGVITGTIAWVAAHTSDPSKASVVAALESPSPPPVTIETAGAASTNPVLGQITITEQK